MSELPSVTPAPPPQPGVVERPRFVDIVRFLIELFAFGSLAFWGFTQFVFPWNLVAGIGAPVVAILVWALFLSPKAVLRVHPFIAALIELLVYLAVTLAWWSMDQAWIGLGFGVIAVVVGVIVGRRRFA